MCYSSEQSNLNTHASKFNYSQRKYCKGEKVDCKKRPRIDGEDKEKRLSFLYIFIVN